MYVDDECCTKFWEEQMKWKLMVPFICPAKVIKFMYFVLMGNGLFPWIAWIIIPNGALMRQSVSLTPMVNIFHLFRDIDGQYCCDSGQRIALLCVVSRPLYCLIKCDMRKRESSPNPSPHDQWQSHQHYCDTSKIILYLSWKWQPHIKSFVLWGLLAMYDIAATFCVLPV